MRDVGEPPSRGQVDRRAVEARALRDALFDVALSSGVLLVNGILAILFIALMQALGVLVGLIVGKQIGITLAAWLVVRSGLASLPHRVSWRHVYGAAWLGGIGFTMSLFVGDLAYRESPALALSKIGILAAPAHKRGARVT